MKRKTLFPLVLAVLLTLSACSSANTAQTEGSSSQTVQTGTEESVSSVNPSDMFTDNDLEIEYDEEASAKITLSGDSASSDSDAVQISDSTVTITDEGTYILSGTLHNGMIVVNAEDTDKVRLVLNGADITNSTSAAIYILEADKVFITTASGTETHWVTVGSMLRLMTITSTQLFSPNPT